MKTTFRLVTFAVLITGTALLAACGSSTPVSRTTTEETVTTVPAQPAAQPTQTTTTTTTTRKIN